MRGAYLGGIALIVATMISDVWLSIDYRIAANVALVLVAILTTMFALLYGFRSNWRANRIGRTLLAKSVVLPFVLWQIVLTVWWDTNFPFRQQIRFTIYGLGAVAFATMVVSLVREQRRDREEDSAGTSGPGDRI